MALKEVAEEARAYKMGGEDKIRVALNTAETIISHTDYIDALDSQLDRFSEISTLLNPTKHLKLEQYYVPGQLKDRKLIATLESVGRRRRWLCSRRNALVDLRRRKWRQHVAAASAIGGKSHKAADSASVSGSAAGSGAASGSKKRKAISGAAVSGSAGSSSKVAKTAAWVRATKMSNRQPTDRLRTRRRRTATHTLLVLDRSPVQRTVIHDCLVRHTLTADIRRMTKKQLLQRSRWTQGRQHFTTRWWWCGCRRLLRQPQS